MSHVLKDPTGEYDGDENINLAGTFRVAFQRWTSSSKFAPTTQSGNVKHEPAYIELANEDSINEETAHGVTIHEGTAHEEPAAGPADNKLACGEPTIKSLDREADAYDSLYDDSVNGEPIVHKPLLEPDTEKFINESVHKTATDTSASDEYANESTVLVDSFRVAFARWTPSDASASTANVKEVAIVQKGIQDNLSPESVDAPSPSQGSGTASNISTAITRGINGTEDPTLDCHEVRSSTTIILHPLSRSKWNIPEPAPMFSNEAHGEPSNQNSHLHVLRTVRWMPSSIKNIQEGKLLSLPLQPTHLNEVDDETDSIASNVPVNGDILPSTTYSQPSPLKPHEIDFEPIPKEKLTRTEEPSEELKAELRAMQDAFRKGYVFKRPNHKQQKKKQKKPRDTYYVVEGSDDEEPNHKNFPPNMPEWEKVKRGYHLYQYSIQAYPRTSDYCSTSGIPSVKQGIPAFEKIPTAPTTEQMLKRLAREGHLYLDGEYDPVPYPQAADSEVNWCYFPEQPDPFKGGRGRAVYSDWIWSWLDETIYNAWIANIYRESFFDGAAHADGMRGFYVIAEWEGDINAYVDRQDFLYDSC
ncbi:hypothetical protein BGW36DRAFT_358348 [Talaromyces proteolyticus]|uniref:Uncharacterized protein n=1 Tax=Talaromyces proteolyticus TaxID=1131652 RepID=A0AAD4PZA7_9EURO|nr:uncharacterized protein BGW36DRAFT_358348 [Talaromyces proteolyticus]KAH8698831.1 hypothetical protein BGW36DRAFT_358348 [Talaromyces proteolyticus]